MRSVVPHSTGSRRISEFGMWTAFRSQLDKIDSDDRSEHNPVQKMVHLRATQALVKATCLHPRAKKYTICLTRMRTSVLVAVAYNVLTIHPLTKFHILLAAMVCEL